MYGLQGVLILTIGQVLLLTHSWKLHRREQGWDGQGLGTTCTLSNTFSIQNEKKGMEKLGYKEKKGQS